LQRRVSERSVDRASSVKITPGQFRERENMSDKLETHEGYTEYLNYSNYVVNESVSKPSVYVKGLIVTNYKNARIRCPRCSTILNGIHHGDVVTCFCGLNLQRFGNALEIRAGSDWVKTKIEKLRAESQLEAMTTDREAMRAELAAMTAERDMFTVMLTAAKYEHDADTEKLAAMTAQRDGLRFDLEAAEDRTINELRAMTVRLEKAEAVCHKWDTADIRPSSDLWEALVAWREAVK